jgi:hypothetical protein
VSRRNLLDDAVHPFLGWKGAFDGDELAVDAEDDRCADLQVNVRCPALDSRLQNAMKYFHNGEGTKAGRGTKDENAAGEGGRPDRGSRPGLAQGRRSSPLRALNANGEDKKACPDEFNKILIHSGIRVESCRLCSPARPANRYPNCA